MACIEKMSVRGIRSFSPDKDETIEFYTPLTMIVGANGCGKTTIIEALKYCCTGTLPPGSRSGQSFVNDPMITDTTEVKANIKLRFRNRLGFPCVVTRSLQLLKKKSKLEFKTLDGVIRTTNAQGDKVSNSYKCMDLDRHVPELLAVTSPILENVIFCHQEDSNWPMQEGVVLKKKFDDVFESTRYAKALEAFAKAKKEFVERGKNLKVELAELGAHLAAASQSRKELDTCEENKDSCLQELEQSETRLSRVEARVQKCREAIQSAQAAGNELKELKWRVEESERRISDRRSGIESLASESDQELRGQLANFDELMQTKNKELRSLQRILDNLNQEISQLRGNLDEWNVKKGLGESLQQQVKDCMNKLHSELNRASREYSLPLQLTLSSWNTGTVGQFMQSLKRKVDDTEAEVTDSIRSCKQVVQRHEAAMLEQKAVKQKLEIEIESKKTEQRRLTDQGEKRRQEMASLSTAKMTALNAERAFEEAKKTYEDFMETQPKRADDIKKQLKEISDEVRELTEVMTNDASLVTEMNLNRNELANLSAAENQLEQERIHLETDVQNLFGIHRDALQLSNTDSGISAAPKEYAGLIPVVSSLMQQTSTVRRQLGTEKERVEKLRSEAAGCEALLRSEQDRLRSSDSRCLSLADKKDKGTQECVTTLNRLRRSAVLAGEFEDTPDLVAGGLSLEELVAAAEDTEERAYEYKSIYESSKFFMKKLEKARKKNGGACPCCLRPMGTDITPIYDVNVKKLFDFKDLVGTEEEYANLYESAKGASAAAKQLERACQPWTEAKRSVDAAADKIRDLEPRVRDLKSQERTAREALSQLESSMEKLDRATSTFSDLKVRWENFNRKHSELRDRRQRQSQSGLGSLSGPNQSIEELEEQQRQRSERKDSLLSRKERLLAEEGALNKRLFFLKSAMADNEKAFIGAKQRGDRYAELESSMRDWRVQSEAIDADIHQMSHRREEAARAEVECNTLLTEARTALSRQEASGNSKLSALESTYGNLSRLNQSLEDSQRRSREADLPGVTAKLDGLQLAIGKKDEEVRSLNPRLNSINAELSSQERTRKNIRDNLELRQLVSDHKNLTAALAALEQTHGAQLQKLTDSQRELERSEQEQRKLTSERDKLMGNLQIYEQQSAELEHKLNSGNYKDVDEKYRKKNIQHETTLMAVSDLTSYHDALDKALQNFHHLKIREINKIIRELWQLIYKGQDIDMIELESGLDLEGTGGATGAAAGGRGSRNYNYRVVMRKGDTPLDMRGRCSAGQKVLASIVIRLALAETFCLNCGILALDEPTTNLDDANKAGLAHALARIIASRSKQQNFQLLCITHDEDFVRMMSAELSGISDFSLPEHYFRVAREELEGAAGSGKYFSHIERIRWDEM